MARECWIPFATVVRPTSGPTATSTRAWAPVFDMYETGDGLVLAVELPGIREKNVSVSITGDLLTVKGERAFDRELKDESSFHLERMSGTFERSIRIPLPVQADRVKATYRDGVLEVRLPRAEEVEPKEIKIDIL